MIEKHKYLKIIVFSIVVILLSISLYLVYKKINKEEQTISPLLYEVTKEGSNNKIYLFGSIHVANNSDLVFPEYVLNAYNKSHFIACEIDTISHINEVQELLINNIIYQDGTTIKDHLKEETYNKLIDFLTKREAYVNIYEYYKPYFFYSLLSSFVGIDANLSSESSIDSYFIDKAMNDNKTVLEVESIEYQMNLLFGFKDLLYDIAIREMIDNYDEEVQNTIDLYKSWKEGNIEKLIELTDEDLKIEDYYTVDEKEAILDYNKKLISDRNKTMTDKVIEYFNNDQDVFFMVGTLHIISEDGIVNNLKENGFIVKEITR